MRCKGFTQSGERCKNHVAEDSEFCHWHQQPEEERSFVEKIFTNNPQALVAFITGATAQAIVADVYHGVMKHFLSSSTRQELNDILQTRFDYSLALEVATTLREQDRHAVALQYLTTFLRSGMQRDEVEQILGTGFEFPSPDPIVQYSWGFHTALFRLKVYYFHNQLRRFCFQENRFASQDMPAQYALPQPNWIESKSVNESFSWSKLIKMLFSIEDRE